MASLLKTLKGKGVGTIVMLLLILFGAYYFASYLTSKGSAGHEAAGESMNAAYSNTPAAGVQPAAPMGENEVYSSAEGTQTSMPTAPTACTTASIQNPSELLPKEAGSGEFAQLNPSCLQELKTTPMVIATDSI